jgi:hypothetical protein
VAAGWSLGGGVAIDLAHRRPVHGMVVLSAFTSVEMAHRLVPLVPHTLSAADRNSRFGAGPADLLGPAASPLRIPAGPGSTRCNAL